MWTSSTTERAVRLDLRILRLRQVKRSFLKAPKRRTRARAYYIELPRKLWDRIILLMFTCCLFAFLHAFLGFGFVDENLDGLNDTFVYPRTPLSTSPPWSRGSVASNMVDWRGNYGLLPSTTPALISPATIPQDAFPDPTPALVRAERGRALGKGSHSMTTKVKTAVDTPFMFYGNLYDPFRLEFEDSDEGSENHGLYPVAGPPRTASQGARTRRFGRCLPGEACF